MASLPASDRPGGRAIAGAQRGWWLEDAVPGGVIRHPGGRTITEGEHVWLAWITHNLSDIHGNADAARRTEWGQPLVLGMLTAAIVIGLAQPGMGAPESAATMQEELWKSITLERVVVAGDTVRAESRIERVEADALESGRVWRTIIGRNQRDEIVGTMEQMLRVPRRRAATDRPS